MIKESGDKGGLTLAVAVDWTEKAPKVRTKLSFATKCTDERCDEVADPDQPELPIMDPSDEQPPSDPAAEPKKKRGRPRKVIVSMHVDNANPVDGPTMSVEAAEAN